MNGFDVEEQRLGFEAEDPKGPKKNKGCLIASVIVIVLVAILIAVPVAMFLVRTSIQETNREKYGGHGFEYMHGTSSTDFTGYHVYDGEQLATLDGIEELRETEEFKRYMIEDMENMPKLDGAEACYPLYTAVAKAIYKDIDMIEIDALAEIERLESEEDENVYDPENDMYWDWKYNNGRIVSFTNTVFGYDRLIRGDVDLFFGARPSESAKMWAESVNEQIVSIPIGREAFVFFVEEDNPVDNLTSDEARKIYSGEITNWSEVGGNDQEIIAFQRPEESGSQVMMKYFMGEVPLMEPDTFSEIDAMGGVIEEVKQYNNERGAIGYTFQYFLTGLRQEQGVKMLAIDGVYPSVENIKNGTYPATVGLMCCKLASNDDPYVQQVVDFLLSDYGQELVEKTGYGPLPRDDSGNVISEPIIENELP